MVACEPMAEIPDLARTEAAIIAQTNAFRREERLAPVVRNVALDQAARLFAQYLAKTGRFAHEADGRQPADRVNASGYQYCTVAENLALNLDSRGFTVEKLSGDAIEGWKNSPGHRKNMLLANVTEIGVGVAQAPGGDPKFLSVQLFGRPRSLAFEFRIANRSASAVAYSFGGSSQELKPRVTATHQACDPGEIHFERAGSWLSGTRIDARYAAAGGALYVITSGADGRIRVDLDRK